MPDAFGTIFSLCLDTGFDEQHQLTNRGRIFFS